MYRYSAFMSYSHADAPFARRLHRRLEAYRLPRRLVSGRISASRQLKPIFRDREELAASPDLSAAVKAALAESQYLIVICSAHAEASEWVTREVALFREMHGEHAVLAVLAEGCSDASFRTLLCENCIEGQSIEPLAADFRRHGDGRSLAFLKLVAVLADVRLDALIQREAQRRIRQVVAFSGSAFAGVMVLASLTVVTMYEHNRADKARILADEARRLAELQRERTETLVKQQQEEVRNKLSKNGRIDILNSLDNGTAEYYKSADVSRLSPQDQEEYAKVLQEVGQDDEASGDLDDASRQYQEAYRLTIKLLAQDNADRNRIFAHAQSEYWVGENAWRTGQYGVAEKKFNAYLALAEELVHGDAHDPIALTEKAYAQSNLGTFFLRSKIDLDRAENYYLASLAAFRAVEALRPEDTDIAKNVAEMYGWLGDVKRLRGDCDAANDYRKQAHKILTELQIRSSSDEIKYDLISEKLALARIDLCKGAPQMALEKLESGRADAKTLADNDPKNIDRRRQVRIFELFQVSTWLSLPKSNQPSDTVISSALGDCATEALLRNNGEIAQYCFILQSRRLKLLGRQDESNASLKIARALAPASADGLSPVWGLNLRHEASF